MNPSPTGTGRKPIRASEVSNVAFLSFFEKEEQRLVGIAERRLFLRSFRVLLPLLYGPTALVFMPPLEVIEDNELLDRLFTALENGASLEQFVAMLPRSRHARRRDAHFDGRLDDAAQVGMSRLHLGGDAGVGEDGR